MSEELKEEQEKPKDEQEISLELPPKFNFFKNDIIDVTLIRFYESFSKTLDTGDFVPDKFNDYIRKYIFKNLKKKFKLVNKMDKEYQKSLKPKKVKKIKGRKTKEITNGNENSNN